ncbi:MAG TPA: GyrI-like domain-containing protein [Polyangiales bacterium]|nr:GyrI-like domain-containing protein [Polyangiales bacterium]
MTVTTLTPRDRDPDDQTRLCTIATEGYNPSVSDPRSYTARINRVLDYVDAHLGDKLDLATLARVAYVSEWHFHRVFQALTGETPGDWVRRRRLEVAAMRLLASRRDLILKIALEVGFRSPEVFTRAFTAHFGVTPSAWRRGAADAWHAKRRLEWSKIRQENRKEHQEAGHEWLQHPDAWPRPTVAVTEESNMAVEIKTLPGARVAYLRYVGPYGTAGLTRTWQRFSAWCGAHALIGAGHTRYGVARDAPELTAPDRCRYDACVVVAEDFVPDSSDEFGVQRIEGGLHACTEFYGTAIEIHERWMHLFSVWLPASAYEVDDRPSVERYGDDSVLEPETGRFSCQLCLPVRPA